MTLKTLEELAKKATPGPWYYPNDGRVVVKAKKGGYPIDMIYDGENTIDHEQSKTNCEYVAAANPQIVLELIERYLGLWMAVTGTLDTLRSINEHQGFLFTQPLMRAMNLIKALSPDVPLGEKK